MKKYTNAIILTLLAFLGAFWWFQFALPRYQTIDLSVNQSEARNIAKKYLASINVNPDEYKTAAIFLTDTSADRFLQRTIGTAKSQALIKELNYDLFAWSIRFFKEKQKEEFSVYVSSKSGEVIALSHAIEDTAARATIDRATAKQRAWDFLSKKFNLNEKDYVFHSDNVKKFANRTDFSFTWESNKVDIPWDKAHGGGSAKFITMATVSGDEVLSFAKSDFDIPEGFTRYIGSLKQTGENLTLIFKILYLCLLAGAIMLVVNQKHHVISRAVKPFYFKLGIFIYVLLVIEVINSYQFLMYDYPTTQAFSDYIIRRFIENLVNPIFIVFTFLLPALAGESLRYEVVPQKKEQGLLSAIRSSFFTPITFRAIIIGYAIGVFILGAQAYIFDLGYQYAGVWEELSWLTKASSSVFPAITAMLIGVQASFSEETMYRLFSINLFKRYGFGVIAVLLSAVMWGVGHTGYEVFPMWFRGLEVTCLGIILGFAYLKFGFIAVLTAHYLMDVFLSVMPHLLVPKFGIDFYASLFVLSVPLIIAIVARILNRSMKESLWHYHFNAQQQFNYRLLMDLAQHKNAEEQEQLRADLIKHGWDPVVVDKVFKKG